MAEMRSAVVAVLLLFGVAALTSVAATAETRKKDKSRETHGADEPKVLRRAKPRGRAAGRNGGESSEAPNVVLILTDDLGYADVGFTAKYALKKVHGRNWQSEMLPEVKTPNIDALANRGVAFTSGYTSGEVCSPTRAGLMAGRYQQGLGIYTAGVGGRGMEILRHDRRTGKYGMVNPWIPHFLTNNGADEEGYVCGAFGKWHLGIDQTLKGKAGARKNTVYDNDADGDFVVFPQSGPITDNSGVTPITEGVPDLYSSIAPLGKAGSPYHPLYRGFDACYSFMGRGGHGYFDPNGMYISMDQRNPSLGKSSGRNPLTNPGNNKHRNTNEEPVESWDSNADPYFIHRKRNPSTYATNKFTNAAVDFIRANAGGPRPFFAYVPYNAPHSPSEAPYHKDADTGELDRMGNDGRRYAGMSREKFARSGIEDRWFRADYDGSWFPDPIFIHEMYGQGIKGADVKGCGAQCTEEERRIRAITTSMVRWVDKGVGQIVDALKDPNGDGDTSDSIFDNTMIIFLSDNGGAGGMRASNKPLKGGKQEIWEGGHRVPFLVAWDKFLSDVDGKGTDMRGALIDKPISSLDILPTIVEASGMADRLTDPLLTSYMSDGKSLLPLIKGDADRHHEYLYWASGRSGGIYDGAVRRGKWKLIVDRKGGHAPFELYDLEDDLGETTNLVEREPEIADELKDAYVSFMNDMASRNGEELPNKRLPSFLKAPSPNPKQEASAKPKREPKPQVPSGNVETCSGPSTLWPKEKLYADKEPSSICSPNGLYRFGMASNGDVSLWRGPNKVWSGGTGGKGTGTRYLHMTAAGGKAIVINKQEEQIQNLWATRPKGGRGAKLIVTNDGNVMVIGANGKVKSTLSNW